MFVLKMKCYSEYSLLKRQCLCLHADFMLVGILIAMGERDLVFEAFSSLLASHVKTVDLL